ncbi:MAG: hypothetical protein A2992_04890 [Elusimicrobia bacterium RIFCSPLOWO2_01_FULL_59_12]|nr:MAG: hypothetical protein A2992_04890 [Elusimicrobia bacterium RIFCSPLOWO2_01_FULL_59_12]
MKSVRRLAENARRRAGDGEWPQDLRELQGSLDGLSARIDGLDSDHFETRFRDLTAEISAAVSEFREFLRRARPPRKRAPRSNGRPGQRHEPLVNPPASGSLAPAASLGAPRLVKAPAGAPPAAANPAVQQGQAVQPSRAFAGEPFRGPDTDVARSARQLFQSLFKDEKPSGTATGGIIGRPFAAFYAWLMDTRDVSLKDIELYWAPLLETLFFQGGLVGLPMSAAYHAGGVWAMLSAGAAMNIMSFLIYGSRLTHPKVYLGMRLDPEYPLPGVYRTVSVERVRTWEMEGTVAKIGSEEKAIVTYARGDLAALKMRGFVGNTMFMGLTAIGFLMHDLSRGAGLWFWAWPLLGLLSARLFHFLANWDARGTEGVIGTAANGHDSVSTPTSGLPDELLEPAILGPGHPDHDRFVHADDPAVVLRELLESARRSGRPGARLLLRPVSTTPEGDEKLAALGLAPDAAREDRIREFKAAVNRYLIEAVRGSWPTGGIRLVKNELHLETPLWFRGQAFEVLQVDQVPGAQWGKKLDDFVQGRLNGGNWKDGLESFRSGLENESKFRLSGASPVPVTFHLPDVAARGRLLTAIGAGLLGPDWARWLLAEEEEAQRQARVRERARAVAARPPAGPPPGERRSRRAPPLVVGSDQRITQFVNLCRDELHRLQAHWTTRELTRAGEVYDGARTLEKFWFITFYIDPRDLYTRHLMKVDSLAKTLRQLDPTRAAPDFVRWLTETLAVRLRGAAKFTRCLDFMANRLKDMPSDERESLLNSQTRPLGRETSRLRAVLRVVCTEAVQAGFYEPALAYLPLNHMRFEAAVKRILDAGLALGLFTPEDVIQRRIKTRSTFMYDSGDPSPGGIPAGNILTLLRELRTRLRQVQTAYESVSPLAGATVGRYYGELAEDLHQIILGGATQDLDPRLKAYFNDLSSLMALEADLNWLGGISKMPDAGRTAYAEILNSAHAVFVGLGWSRMSAREFLDPDHWHEMLQRGRLWGSAGDAGLRPGDLINFGEEGLWELATRLNEEETNLAREIAWTPSQEARAALRQTHQEVQEAIGRVQEEIRDRRGSQPGSRGGAPVTVAEASLVIWGAALLWAALPFPALLAAGFGTAYLIHKTGLPQIPRWVRSIFRRSNSSSRSRVLRAA